ncbi:MAG TPA: hypothetical protein V6D30_01970 [Leptolyngbyaceae cyanobacterium]
MLLQPPYFQGFWGFVCVKMLNPYFKGDERSWNHLWKHLRGGNYLTIECPWCDPSDRPAPKAIAFSSQGDHTSGDEHE